MIDDVIHSCPNYLSQKICKNFLQQYGMQLSYSQPWNFKEKAKEKIHNVP